MLVLVMEDSVDLQHVSLIHWQPLVILPMVMESDMNMEYSNNPLMAMGVRYIIYIKSRLLYLSASKAIPTREG